MFFWYLTFNYSVYAYVNFQDTIAVCYNFNKEKKNKYFFLYFSLDPRVSESWNLWIFDFSWTMWVKFSNKSMTSTYFILCKYLLEIWNLIIIWIYNAFLHLFNYQSPRVVIYNIILLTIGSDNNKKYNYYYSVIVCSVLIIFIWHFLISPGVKCDVNSFFLLLLIFINGIINT